MITDASRSKTLVLAPCLATMCVSLAFYHPKVAQKASSDPRYLILAYLFIYFLPVYVLIKSGV